MEDIKIYTDTIYQLKMIRKYLEESDTEKILIRLNKIDSGTAGAIVGIIKRCMAFDDRFETIKKKFIGDNIINFKVIDEIDHDISLTIRLRLGNYITKRIGELGNYIAHVES